MIRALAAAAVLAAPGLALAAPAPHSFDLTYRGFGPVSATSDFRAADGYDLRFEGCFAKHSSEAVCGFTLRAKRSLTVSNIANLSHGSGADGAAIRTCCIFVQGDPQGYPITRDPQGAPGAAVLQKAVAAGESAGLMLRVPNYRAGPPLAAITFSRGQGDAGLSFPAHITELP